MPAKRWLLPPGRGWTALLVIAALVMMMLAGVRAWTRLHPRIPAGASTPAPAAQAPEPVFRDVTAEAGVRFLHINDARGQFRLPEEMGAGAGFLDYDSDGDLDLYLVQGGSLGGDDPAQRNVLLRNDGTGRFENVSAGSGADVAGFGMGCAMADVDNDADVDILVTRLGPAALLLNDGAGRFRDATIDSGVNVDGFGAGACFLDYDRDGWLDLYVARYVDWSPGIEKPCYDAAGARDYCNPTEYRSPAVNRLLHNVGGGRFEDVTHSSGIGGVAGHSLGLVCSDFTADDCVDVFVANDQTPGRLWINGGDGTFREDAALRGCAFSGDGLAIAGMGTAAEDFDGDGDFDLLITNLHDLIDLALRNEAGLFEDVSHSWGLDGWGVLYTGFGLIAFDQDHDGRLDLMLNNGAVLRLSAARFPGHDYAEPTQFVRWTDQGRFADFTEAAGPALRQPCVGRAAAAGDVDGDGDIDVVLTCNGGPARLLRNENRSDGAWVILDLVARGGGRHALNARVEVQAGGRRWLREVRPHTSYLSSHDPRVHVGMGEARRIDRLTVKWPAGEQEEWIDLPVNRVLRIEQGTGVTH